MKLPVIVAILVCAAASLLGASDPISLHPENPHYFRWRHKPTVLITSGEHYGAVINSDFDYSKYLRALASQHLNLTRTWTGYYVEPSGAFNIASNSLAPLPGRFICPWARSSEPGYANGGNKFDLSKWDEKYFTRLHDFMRQASEHGVVVELNLFCPFYDEGQWKLAPFNPKNNVNGTPDVARTNVYTMDKNGGLLAGQEALVRKLVNELNEYDNLYYEICNEPYFGGVTLEWQHHIADVITRAEAPLEKKHLISQNIANGHQKVINSHPAVSIFNFHYASPPVTVAENYALNKVIGLNETGFKGTNNTHYRMEAWEFILAGGGLYNNLDYSFVAGHERGDFVYPAKQPGGGNKDLRQQFSYLRDFITSFDFVRMKPDRTWIRAGVPDRTHVQALAESGNQYAAYFFSGAMAPKDLSLTLNLPDGKYRVEWFDVLTGRVTRSGSLTGARAVTLTLPEYRGEVALRLRR